MRSPLFCVSQGFRPSIASRRHLGVTEGADEEAMSQQVHRLFLSQSLEQSHLQHNPPLKLAFWFGLQMGILCL